MEVGGSLEGFPRHTPRNAPALMCLHSAHPGMTLWIHYFTGRKEKCIGGVRKSSNMHTGFDKNTVPEQSVQLIN